MKKLLLAFFLTSLFLCCNKKINQFIQKNIDLAETYTPYFQKNKVKQLKKEWEELYLYLEKGSILEHNEEKGTQIFSYALHSFLSSNILRVYQTPFLNNMDNLIAVFGNPRSEQDRGEVIQVDYSPFIVDDTCQTCTHTGFSFEFDKKTKKLIMFGEVVE